MKARPLPGDDEVLPTADAYDAWSEIYESDGNPLTLLEEPLVEALLGPARGLRVADVGCGTGRYAIPLAAQGAEVTALDFSSGMLERAAQKPGAERVHFVAHDLGRLPWPLPSASFDRALSCLVLEHIEDLDAFFGELRRITHPRGTAVVTAMHPAMMLIGKQASFRDPVTGDKKFPKSHPHQVSDIVMAAVRSGWHLEHLGEHAIDEDFAARVPRAAKYRGWLMLLTMRLSARAPG